jgi:hypothetical protein
MSSRISQYTYTIPSINTSTTADGIRLAEDTAEWAGVTDWISDTIRESVWLITGVRFNWAGSGGGGAILNTEGGNSSDSDSDEDIRVDWIIRLSVTITLVILETTKNTECNLF